MILLKLLLHTITFGVLNSFTTIDFEFKSVLSRKKINNRIIDSVYIIYLEGRIVIL